jgi:hypothetical protein
MRDPALGDRGAGVDYGALEHAMENCVARGSVQIVTPHVPFDSKTDGTILFG